MSFGIEFSPFGLILMNQDANSVPGRKTEIHFDPEQFFLEHLFVLFLQNTIVQMESINLGQKKRHLEEAISINPYRLDKFCQLLTFFVYFTK
jgi:hypothetical protein